ncbi:GNAT family N-acetyltransferase [Paenibacillus sp. PR3]|uniref:GNAT family N-acetyltransferase n=1 Tax=Paenibacillus terricola TaxID=2763503 RepID=A0ABR8MXA0_9BACL|nr:GNAT family N-acetyltransferase [Paenibacillus terricola]MBD3920600.1 GNAT family N-acetyltransferase [Paenibacillus terricola]
MFELSRDQFYKAAPLLDYGHPHPEVQSILENNNPGWVFVDQPDAPRTAFVWSKGMQGHYLIGDETNEACLSGLDAFVTTTIAPRMKDRGMNYFEISGHHDNWNLHSLFASRELQQPWDQIVYETACFEAHTMDTPDNLRVVNLRSQEWKLNEYDNKNFVYDHIHQFWETEEAFDEKGYGYAAIENSEVIGVCYSSFVTKQRHAVGVETLPRRSTEGWEPLWQVE